MIFNLGIAAISNCLIAALIPYLITILKNNKIAICLLLFSTFILSFYGISRLLFCSSLLSYLLIKEYKLNARWTIFIIVTFTFLIYWRFESVFGRLLIYWIILSNVASIPLFGYGLNSFKYVYYEWQSIFFAGSHSSDLAIKVAEAPSFAFNEFLQVWIEFGILGLILMIVILLFHLLIICKNCTLFKIVGLSNLIIFGFSFFSYPFHSIFVLLLFIGNFFYILTKIFNKVKVVFIVTFTFFCFYSFFIIYSNFKGTQKWRELNNIPFSYIEEKDSLYKMALSDLQDEQLFLNDYTQFLVQTEQFDAAQELIFKRKIFYNQYERVMHNGNIWFKKNTLDSAIIYYMKAHNFIPSKFIPLHLLTICYLKNNEIAKAQRVSRLIRRMPIKVNSGKVQYIKTFADSVLKY